MATWLQKKMLGGVLLGLVAFVAVASSSRTAAAAIYWGNGSSIAGSALDGSSVDFSYIGAFDSEEIGRVCGVAVDTNYIYWADFSRDQIGRANLDGTEPNFSFITSADQPCGVAVDSAHIYWANTGGGSIGRANLDGTGPNQRFIGLIRQPCGVALKGHLIYWASPWEEAVGRALVYNGDAQDNNWIEGLRGACGVAVDDSHIYWGSFSAAIGRADLQGGNVNPAFITGLDRPAGIAVDTSRIYWTEEGFGVPGQAGVANLDGGAVNRALATGLSDPNGIAVDAQPFPLDRSAHLPPSQFRFARVKHNRNRRDPVTFLAVDVPQQGLYSVEVPRGVGWNSISDDPYKDRFLAGGRHWLSIYLDDSGAGRRLARAIRRRGRVAISITFRFTEMTRSPIDQQKMDHNPTARQKTLSIVGERRR